MINTNNKKVKGASTSLGRQKKAVIIIASICLVLAIALAVVNFLAALRPFEVAGEEGVKYYIVRHRDENGKYYFVLADENRNTLPETEDGYFVTKSGALVAIDQSTGLGSIYARPATDGNEQLGTSDRVLIFPYTPRAEAQSIKVVNQTGEYTFYRRRIYTDTDYSTYTCLLVGDDYRLVAPKDPTDPESEYVEYTRGADGYYTLASGNKLSISARTGIIRSVEYTDHDGKKYTVVKGNDGAYFLADSAGNKVSERISKKGERHDSEGKAYTDTLYDYYVTEFGSLISVDAEYGVISGWGVREYDPSTKKFATYHFLKRGGDFVLCDADGKLITETSIDDKDYFSTANNAYIAFNEDNGSYKVRVQKNYYLIADNDGNYALYNKSIPLGSNTAGYYALPDGESFVSFDAVSGSFAILKYDGEKYVETQTKYLNGAVETNAEGEFVIKGYEDTDYDPSLFAALITNGGYTITPQGGKLANPERHADGSINFEAYGLVEGDRVDATGTEYHHVPSYYVFTDLKGNVHKIIYGDQTINGTGFYVRYERISASEAADGYDDSDFVAHNAVYVLNDNYSMGFTETYETFYYYSISDTFLAPIENIVTPKVVPTTSTSTYFDVKNFVISRLNHDKLHADILGGSSGEGDYRDIWINFTYYDVEERRNTVNASIPYVMGACELYGFNINDNSVNNCLLAMMDLKANEVKKLGPSYADLIKYGLDEPEYILYYELGATGETPMLLISKLTVNDTYYVYTQDYDMIVEIDRSALSFLSWSDSEWLTKEVYNASVGFCDNIKLEKGEYWANFDIDMSLTLETKINPGTPSTFTQNIYSSDKRDGHVLSLAANINANTSTPLGSAELITVDFATLRNYYKYIESGGKTTGMGAVEVANLAAFIETVAEHDYDTRTGNLSTIHNLTLSDSIGNVYLISIMFNFDITGEVLCFVQINKEDVCLVFSLKAYESYEKIIFSDSDVDEEDRELAYGFYTQKGVSASSRYAFDKITATNSDGVTSIYTDHKIERTDKNGKVTVDYCLSNDYRVFFNVNGEDLVGVSNTFVRFYDMSNSSTTTDGAYETVKNLPYKFEATQVRLVTAGANGGTETIKDGTLGEGKYTVEITEDMVTVTDENGNVTRYLRYAGTSVFSSFYSVFVYASYEGVCDLPKEDQQAFVEGDAWDFNLTIDTKLSRDENGKGVSYVYKTFKYSERRSFITMNGKGDFFVLTSFINKIVDSSKKVFDNVIIDPAGKY